MPTKVGDMTVTVTVDATRFERQIDSLLEPLTWRHALIEWIARRLDVQIEVKRRMRGYRKFRGGYI